jgi:hypothetical protein
MFASAVILIISSLICGVIIIPYSESIRDAAPEALPSRECYQFPADTNYIKLEKQISDFWIWTYSITAKTNSSNTTIGGEFYMRYPTSNNDLNIWIPESAKYVGRTDGKVFSFVSEIDIRDCHNNLKYTMKSGSALQTFINSFNIDVSLEISANGTTQYYIKKDNLFTSSIDVFNNRSIKVAHLYQNKYNNIMKLNGWTWDISILDPTNNPIDPLILISIAGSQSFQEKDSKGRKQTDYRNGFYIALIVLFSISGAIVLIGIGIVCWSAYKNGSPCSWCCGSSRPVRLPEPTEPPTDIEFASN